MEPELANKSTGKSLGTLEVPHCLTVTAELRIDTHFPVAVYLFMDMEIVVQHEIRNWYTFNF